MSVFSAFQPSPPSSPGSPASPRSPFTPSSCGQDAVDLLGRRKLRDLHRCAPHEYTPQSKPDGWHLMPKEVIPIEEAPQGAWSPPGSEQWPPKGKVPCVTGDGSRQDRTGVPDKPADKPDATPCKRQKSLSFTDPPATEPKEKKIDPPSPLTGALFNYVAQTLWGGSSAAGSSQ